MKLPPIITATARAQDIQNAWTQLLFAMDDVVDEANKKLEDADDRAEIMESLAASMAVLKLAKKTWAVAWDDEVKPTLEYIDRELKEVG